MKCPVCKDVTLLMTEKKGIEVDYCPECRGIWLDRGELEKIIEKENTYVESKTENKTFDKKDKEPHQKRKRESVFGEIFDIFGD